jgi:hypothetical protein
LFDSKKNGNYVLTVAVGAAKTANTSTMVPVVGFGGVWFWRESGIWSRATGFVLIPLAAICFSRREDVYTFNLVCKEI